MMSISTLPLKVSGILGPGSRSDEAPPEYRRYYIESYGNPSSERTDRQNVPYSLKQLGISMLYRDTHV